jgi:hypothetical protein
MEPHPCVHHAPAPQYICTAPLRFAPFPAPRQPLTSKWDNRPTTFRDGSAADCWGASTGSSAYAVPCRFSGPVPGRTLGAKAPNQGRCFVPVLAISDGTW